MPISPLAAGDGRVQHWTFTTDSGIFSLAGLQNSNIVMHMQDINNNNAIDQSFREAWDVQSLSCGDAINGSGANG